MQFHLNVLHRLQANPLARSPGQVKLDSGKWKLWKKFVFNIYNFFSKFGFRASRWKKIKAKTVLIWYMGNTNMSALENDHKNEN
jgi:hypothetical protein